MVIMETFVEVLTPVPPPGMLHDLVFQSWRKSGLSSWRVKEKKNTNTYWQLHQRKIVIFMIFSPSK